MFGEQSCFVNGWFSIAIWISNGVTWRHSKLEEKRGKKWEVLNGNGGLTRKREARCNCDGMNSNGEGIAIFDF
jgi:hypothetical protein